jgi:hypothetical protein
MTDFIFDKIGYIFIDFDNWIKNPLHQITDKELEFLFSTYLLNFINDEVYDRIYIRLYGGWYKQGILTSKASELQMKLSQISIFPYINQQKRTIIRGNIEIVNSSLNLPKIIWSNTYHERNGIPRLRINDDKATEVCNENSDKCPIKLLYNFTKHKSKKCSVPGCANQHNEVFFAREQKMVDTLIACDLIYCSKEKNIVNVQLISDDIDHIPALLDSSYNSIPKGKYSVVFKNQETILNYSELFQEYNIRTINLEL